MSELQTLSFNGLPVALIDHNNEGWFTGEDIGVALEYADDPKNSVRKIFERNQEELEEYSTTVKLTAVDGKERDQRVYNEEGVMMICFFSKQPKAAEFRKWAVMVLKNYRHGDNLAFVLKPITAPISLEEFQTRHKILTEAFQNLKNAQVHAVMTGEQLLGFKSHLPRDKGNVSERHWKHWTAEEKATFYQLQSEGKDDWEIAQQLNRTPRGVSSFRDREAQKEKAGA